MADLVDITRYLEKTLEISSFPDSSMNGLQIEGTSQVTRIAVAVDAGLSIVKKAIKENVQLLFVHHGLFWDRPQPLVSSTREVVKLALGNDLSLIAAHLPLDAHPIYGNNWGIAKLLGLEKLTPAAFLDSRAIGCVGENSRNYSREQIAETLRSLPGAGTKLLSLEFGPERPSKICVVSGAGTDELYRYQSDGFDTLVTGEPRQFAYHFCQERSLNCLFAGHYATETVGVRAIGKALGEEFGIDWVFVDEPTGI